MKEKKRKENGVQNWCFWTVALKKTLMVPWTARRSNQLILKEISPEYSLGGLMLKHKLQYFGHQRWEELTHWKRPWCWESLMVLEGNDRGWDGWMASLTRQIRVWLNSGSCWWTRKPGVLQSTGSQSVGHWTKLDCGRSNKWNRDISNKLLILNGENLLRAFQGQAF